MALRQQGAIERLIGLVEPGNADHMAFNRCLILTAHHPLIQTLQDELTRTAAR